MPKLTNKEIERALKNLSKYNNLAAIERNKIAEHCYSVYGFSPGDIDNDDFIDACDSGGGLCKPMTSKEFDDSMKNCLKQKSLC